MSEQELTPPTVDPLQPPKIVKKELQTIPVAFRGGDRERVTYSYRFAHQQVGHNPVSLEGGLSRDLENAEQGYVRHYKLDASKGWVDVDLGWIEHPGLIILENRTGKLLQVQPTTEQRAEINEQIVLWKTDENAKQAFKLRPWGGFNIIEANDIPSLQVHCVSGIANLTIAIFPN